MFYTHTHTTPLWLLGQLEFQITKWHFLTPFFISALLNFVMVNFTNIIVPYDLGNYNVYNNKITKFTIIFMGINILWENK